MWLAFPTSDYYDGSDALPPHQPQLVQTFAGRVARASNVHNAVRFVLLEFRLPLYPRTLLLVVSYPTAGLHPCNHCRFP